MDVYAAARALLEPRLGDIRAYERAHPAPVPPTKRTMPDVYDVWTRYCHSVITRMQKITDEFWQALTDDPDWMRLAGGRGRAPTLVSITNLFERHKVRFRNLKAEEVRAAWDRATEFEELGEYLRSILLWYHDRQRPLHELRGVEVQVAARIQEVLPRLGVGPKIARLMMIWNPARDDEHGEFFNVIPIDSRWKGKLQEAGADIQSCNLSSEQAYCSIEEDICRACFDLGISPRHADGAVFGWIPSRLVED